MGTHVCSTWEDFYKDNRFYCPVCGKPKLANAANVPDLNLASPEPSVARICCVGHGTWSPEDRQFIVPRNVVVRFRVPHGSQSFSTNELRVRPLEDKKFGQLCYNNRLWPLTGGERTTLPAPSTQDARDFIRSWRCAPGQQLGSMSTRLVNQVALADIVYGLGGAASLDGGRAWEVIWLACREVVRSNGAIKQMQLQHETHGVTFA